MTDVAAELPLPPLGSSLYGIVAGVVSHVLQGKVSDNELEEILRRRGFAAPPDFPPDLPDEVLNDVCLSEDAKMIQEPRLYFLFVFV